MPDLGPLSSHQSAKPRHQFGGDRLARFERQRRGDLAAKSRTLQQRLVQIGRRPGDEVDGVVVAGLGAVTPADDPMAGQHHAAQAGIGGHIVAQRKAQVEARPLPGQPADLAAIDLFRRGFASGRGGQGDHGVGMHMVDVGERQVGVQRRVDRGRARVEVEGAVGQVAHHLVLVRQAAIELFQAQQLVEIKGRKAVQLHRADVAARPLHPQDVHRRAGERIGLR